MACVTSVPAVWLLGTIRTELKRQREKANSPVVQVVQLGSLLERLSDCRTVPWQTPNRIDSCRNQADKLGLRSKAVVSTWKTLGARHQPT